MSPSTLTLADLGRMLDLDKSTVSLALRGSDRIAPATRRRVLAAADRHGYRPNLAARQLISGQGKPALIGFFLPRSLSSLLGSMAVRTMRLLAQRVEAGGMLFQLASPAEDGATGMRPDAAFLWGDIPRAEADEVLRGCARTVVIDPCHSSWAGYDGPCARLDNLGGGARMARLLSQRGARRLLFVQARSEHLGQHERWLGARAAWIEERPLDSVSCCMHRELNDGQLADFTRAGDGAILCASDGIALRVWKRLGRLGVQLPAQARLASFDGEDYARVVGITTAVFDCAALAAAASDALLGEEPMPPIQTVAFQLHEGETT